MARLTEIAPAKINLALHVTGQRDDGYHTLETLVCFAKGGGSSKHSAVDILHSEVHASNTNETSLEIIGPFSRGLNSDDDNLVLQAVRLFKHNVTNLPPINLVLEKNLPIASGIGGGSADAAAALRLCNRIVRNPLPQSDMMSLAASLGADVPMCLAQQPAIAKGIGDELQNIPLPALPLLLVNPNITVSTPPVFKQLAVKTNQPLDILPHLMNPAEFRVWLKKQRNDLQQPALTLCPDIETVLQELKTLPHVELVRMSGSGATCFGLFPDMQTVKSAALFLQQKHPTWWVCATQTGTRNEYEPH